MEQNLENYQDYRYNIKQRIDRMHIRRRTAIRKTMMKHVSYTAYYDLLKLKRDATRDMDANVLRAFSKILQVDMELLFND